MKIKEISYEKSMVIPTGQYSNARVGATITYQFEEGESPKHDSAATELDNIIAIQRQNLALETLFTEEKKVEVVTPAPVVQVQAPVATPSTPSPVAETTTSCPKCGFPLVEAVKKDGGKYTKCSASKWDPRTKTASGCDYVDWGDNVKPAQSSSGLASVAQMNIIKSKWPNEWRDGMTKAEAFKLIASHPRT